MKKLLVPVIVLAVPLLAHHSAADTYLEDAPPITVEGKLVQFLFRNPHSSVQVEVTDAKTGKTTLWSVEWRAAEQLARQGVSKTTLKIGDTVKVTGSPARDTAEHRLWMRSIIRLSNGWSWGNKGQISYQRSLTSSAPPPGLRKPAAAPR